MTGNNLRRHYHGRATKPKNEKKQKEEKKNRYGLEETATRSGFKVSYLNKSSMFTLSLFVVALSCK